MAFYQSMGWHEGEDKVHKLTKVPRADNPTQPLLTANAAHRISTSPLIALGTYDKKSDKVWCGLWGGQPPLAQPVARGGIMGFRASVDASYDPFAQSIYDNKNDGEVVRGSAEDGKMIAGLSIFPEDRDRMKFYGRMLAGSLQADDPGNKNIDGKTGSAQLVMQITQSLGNCPKYITKKIIKPRDVPLPQPRLLSDSITLIDAAVQHVLAANMMYIASLGPEDMDCNHRGGPPGFIRVQQPDTNPDSSVTSTQLIWPEYSGNNLYQTLGNLTYSPLAGIVIPNLETGTVLYVSGTAEVLFNQAASSIIQKTRLAVRFTVTACRLVEHGLTFRGELAAHNNDKSSSSARGVNAENDKLGLSPYNPRVRYLVSETKDRKQTSSDVESVNATGSERERLTVSLSQKQKLTPTITRYIFTFESHNSHSFDPTMSPLWKPGQYVILDFSEEMNMGYSHMRDDDPGSLNDDFLRSFTVTNRWTSVKTTSGTGAFEIIVRNVGSVTSWLERQRVGGASIEVKGFEGEFVFAKISQGNEGAGDVGIEDKVEKVALEESKDGTEDVEGREKLVKSKVNVFIAAGIGITPLLAQLKRVDESDKEDPIVLWTLHIKDVGLLDYVLSTCTTTIKNRMRVFVTGTARTNTKSEDLDKLEKVVEREGRVSIERRRLEQEDILRVEKQDGFEVGNWYACMAPPMRKAVQEWLGERVLIYENFDY